MHKHMYTQEHTYIYGQAFNSVDKEKYQEATLEWNE